MNKLKLATVLLAAERIASVLGGDIDDDETIKRLRGIGIDEEELLNALISYVGTELALADDQEIGTGLDE